MDFGDHDAFYPPELVSVGHCPGRKLLTVVHTLLAGDCIDDTDILRSGATGDVVGS